MWTFGANKPSNDNVTNDNIQQPFGGGGQPFGGGGGQPFGGGGGQPFGGGGGQPFGGGGGQPFGGGFQQPGVQATSGWEAPPPSIPFGSQQQAGQQPIVFGRSQKQRDQGNGDAGSEMWFGGGRQRGSAFQQQQRPRQGAGFPTVTHNIEQGKGIKREDNAEEEEVLDYEAAKREALASMPTFAGGGSYNRDGGKPPRKPPSAGGRSRIDSGIRKDDDEEDRRKKERASRFAAPSTAAIDARLVEPPVRQEGVGAGDEDEDSVLAGAIVGTCEDMCPASERERRQNMSDIQIFERVDPENPSLTSPELAVKRFARTIDDPRPSDFRTRGALTRTMSYLRNLLDREDVRFGLVHKFLWDRYRSIRQDLYIQGIQDHFAIGIFEEIVRFHVLCEHELSGDDQSVTNMEGFNSHLNMEQMNKALISLIDMYEKAAVKGDYCSNEPEFRAYHLLSLMSQHGKFKGDQQAFMSMLQSLRVEVRESSAVRWVLDLKSSFVFSNFAKFFTLVRQAPYLLACLSHIYFPQVRAQCFRVLSETIMPKQPSFIEASWFKKTLLLDSEEEALKLAQQHGFQVKLDDGSPTIILVKGTYVPLPVPVIRYPSQFISSMAPGERSLCVTSPMKPLDPEEVQRQMELRRKQQEQQERLQRQQEEMRKQMDLKRREEEQARQEAQKRLEIERQEQEKIRLAKEEADRLERVRRDQEARHQAEEEIRKQNEREEKERRRKEEESKAAERLRAAREAKKRAEAIAAKRRAEEEEARRLAAEREAKRIAEENRRKEEERRKYLICSLRKAILMKRYLDRWLDFTQKMIAERERALREAQNLKGCRVGAFMSRTKRIRDEGISSPPSCGKRSRNELEEVNLDVLIQVPQLLNLVSEGLNVMQSYMNTVYWKLTVLVQQAKIYENATAKCLHFMCSLQGSKLPLVRHETFLCKDKPALGKTKNMHICVAFVVGYELSPTILEEALQGSSAVAIVSSKNREQSFSEVEDVLKLTSWKGPRLPLLIFSDSSNEEEPATLDVAGHKIHLISNLPCTPEVDRWNDISHALIWMAKASPRQPSFTCSTLKQCLSQGFRSFVQEKSERTDTLKGLQLVQQQPYEKAFELVVDALDVSFKSEIAAWHWPPDEFRVGVPVDGWYSIERYDEVFTAVKAMYALFKQKQILHNNSLLSLHAMMNEALEQDVPVVIPDSVAPKYSRILVLNAPEEGQKTSLLRRAANRISWRVPKGMDRREQRDPNASLESQNRSLRAKMSQLEEEVRLEKMQAQKFAAVSLRHDLNDTELSVQSSLDSEVQRDTRSTVLDQTISESIRAEKSLNKSFLSKLKRIGKSLFF